MFTHNTHVTCICHIFKYIYNRQRHEEVIETDFLKYKMFGSCRVKKLQKLFCFAKKDLIKISISDQ